MKTLALFLLAVGIAYAQGPASIQQSPTVLDSGLLMQTTATTGTTLTLTPLAAQSIYIKQIDFSNCQDATGISAAASPTQVTTTNLYGLQWNMASGGATAGSCPQSFSISYPTGLKAATPGTAVTVVTPTYITHQTIRVTVTYYSAP